MPAAASFPFLRRRLPVLLQTEAAECGLACLAMIAAFHGHAIDLPAMRRRFPTSARGATLASLISSAHGLGFEARPLRVELDYLPHLQTPCILHWNLNHFVVLKRATSSRVEIHDPAGGARVLSPAEASRHFTGIALELRPAADFRPIEEQQAISLSALTGRLHGIAGAVAQVLLLALGLEAFTLILPFYVQAVLDQVLVTADMHLLTLLGIGFLFVVSFQALLSVARGWAISWIGGKLSAQWETNLFGHLVRLPMAYFERRHVGDVISRFTSVQVIQQTLTGNFVESVLNGLVGSATLILLCAYSVPLTAIVMAGLAVYVACRWMAFRRIWRINEQQIVYVARQQTSMVEAIRGVQTIKLANKQGERSARFASVVLQATQYNVAVQRVGFAFSAASQWLFGVQRVVIVWIAADQVLKGSFSAGMLVAFVAYADQLTTSLGGLVDKLVDFRMLRLHASRIADIALTPPEDTGRGTAGSREGRLDIEIDEVGFRYSDADPWVLRKCSLRIAEGESIAIVGPSGCGKTTLAKLILGLLEPTEGQIRIGGVDIRQYGLGAFRDLVGCVMQDDELFEGSIADNISFFDEAASPAQIEAAARQAAIHDEILAMPMGYETLVGNMGASLSGGQKQRIVLARAFYRKPRILVLDEATSHLDAKCERAVNAATRRTNATQVVIAHRQETIAMASRVFRLGADGSEDERLPSGSMVAV
jgi:ATP-binding cassette subfamily B protein RaxB